MSLHFDDIKQRWYLDSTWPRIDTTHGEVLQILTYFGLEKPSVDAVLLSGYAAKAIADEKGCDVCPTK